MSGYRMVVPGVFELMTAIGGEQDFDTKLLRGLARAARLVTKLAGEDEESAGRVFKHDERSHEGFRLRDGFFRLCDGDQLVHRWLGSTVPRFVQVRNRCARQHRRRWRQISFGRTGSRSGGPLDSCERCTARSLFLFPGCDNLLNLLAERIYARVRMAPGIDEGFGIKRAGKLADVGELEQARACGNQEANGEVNRRNIFFQTLLGQHAEQIQIPIQRCPRSERDKRRLKDEAESTEIFDNSKKISARVPFLQER